MKTYYTVFENGAEVIKEHRGIEMLKSDCRRMSQKDFERYAIEEAATHDNGATNFSTLEEATKHAKKHVDIYIELSNVNAILYANFAYIEKVTVDDDECEEYEDVDSFFPDFEAFKEMYCN